MKHNVTGKIVHLKNLYRFQAISKLDCFIFPSVCLLIPSRYRLQHGLSTEQGNFNMFNKIISEVKVKSGYRGANELNVLNIRVTLMKPKVRNNI